MSAPIRTIIRNATKREKFNILTCIYDGYYEQSLSYLPHDFYYLNVFAANPVQQLPPNFYPIKLTKQDDKTELKLPLHLDFDCLLIHERNKQFQLSNQISRTFHIPTILIDHHTIESIPPHLRDNALILKADYNLASLSILSTEWNSNLLEYGVHIDVEKQNEQFDVVIYGNFNKGEINVAKQLAGVGKTAIFGTVDGQSHLPKMPWDMFNCKVFVMIHNNLSVPFMLLKAMSAKCAVVINETLLYNDLIQNQINGFTSNDIATLRKYIAYLLNDQDKRRAMGEAAQSTIRRRFNIGQFVDNWNNVLNTVCNKAKKI